MLDVHPFNKDRVIDPTVQLWITEGIKKGDALTSAGACTVTLSGVFNWRSSLGSLGDWEDVPLNGREVIVCFDADARANANVARAMDRLGKWLVSKGAGRVRYLVVPADVNGEQVKGADDYLVAGGTLGGLLGAATDRPPEIRAAHEELTDAELSDLLAEDVLEGNYSYTAGWGWLRWAGCRWVQAPDQDVTEQARLWVLAKYADTLASAAQAAAAGETDRARKLHDLAGQWRKYQARPRIEAITGLARGVVLTETAKFDAYPDLLNCTNGVVHLPTGELRQHDPDLYLTKITGCAYHPSAKHADWDQALQAVPKDVRDWYRLRLGQGITGHMTPDDLLVVQQGAGSNGKTTLWAGIRGALGDYVYDVPHRALLGASDQVPTEVASFQGVRLALLEELPEERRLSTMALKQLVGTPTITARRLYRDPVTFPASHTLFVSTNYLPQVNETDTGTWRRLACLRFPYQFTMMSAQAAEVGRAGDPTLRERLVQGIDGQQEAALAWLVDGAREWYERERIMPDLPSRVADDTRTWRKALT